MRASRVTKRTAGAVAVTAASRTGRSGPAVGPGRPRTRGGFARRGRARLLPGLGGPGHPGGLPGVPGPRRRRLPSVARRGPSRLREDGRRRSVRPDLGAGDRGGRLVGRARIHVGALLRQAEAGRRAGVLRPLRLGLAARAGRGLESPPRHRRPARRPGRTRRTGSPLPPLLPCRPSRPKRSGTRSTPSGSGRARSRTPSSTKARGKPWPNSRRRTSGSTGPASFPAVGLSAAKGLIPAKEGKVSRAGRNPESRRTSYKVGLAWSGDLAWSYGTVESVGGRAAHEGTAYLRIWRRVPPGAWKICLDVVLPVPPPPGADGQPFITPMGTTLATRRPSPASCETRTTSSTSL
ncbi:MAG: hypothetical protein M0C28_42950 [Candidatus Moduliflexus flocculans]|nr:hypothetical protein [Candidatus Moduliflexus flocculans]